MSLFRFRISRAEMRFMTPQTMPVIRRDHANDILSIIAWVPKEKIKPPMPEPAEPIPFAKLRFLSNHCGRMAMLGIETKPTPKPTSMPCERKSCQISRAKEAEIKPAASRTAPRVMVGCVLYLRAKMVTTGATSMAMEKFRPPMRAKSILLAPGYVSDVR